MGKTYKAYVKQKEKQQRSENRKKNGGPFMRGLASLAGAVVIVYSVSSFVVTQADIAEKKKKLSQLEEKAAQLEAKMMSTLLSLPKTTNALIWKRSLSKFSALPIRTSAASTIQQGTKAKNCLRTSLVGHRF